MLRITRKEQGEVVFKVSGQLNAENLQEMTAVIAAEAGTSRIALDLKDLTSADCEAVKFLAKCEAAPLELRQCGAYIRERIRRERLEGESAKS
jgi:anti-anti-sigma regulatory factor